MGKTSAEFWELVQGVWNYGVLGVDLGKIIGALAIFLGFLMIRGLFSKYILSKAHLLTSKTDNQMDDKIIAALIPPVRFIPIILGVFFAAHYAGLNDALGDTFIRLMRSLIAFAIFWGIHRSLEPISHVIRGLDKILTPMMTQWMVKALDIIVLFLGGAIILELWGIHVAPLLAGLGLFGAAIALGAQDLFKNLIAGITIIAEKRFQPGDWIKVSGVVEGTVENIGFRSTMVRRFDKAPVHVPNGQLSDAAVTNFSRMTHRRIKWKLGVRYDASIEQLKIIRDEITKHLAENDNFAPADEVSTFVRVDSFNDSSIDFLIYCFTKTTNWGEWLAIKEDFAMVIKDIIENKAGSDFAFPSQSIYVENGFTEKAEIFVPPADK